MKVILFYHSACGKKTSHVILHFNQVIQATRGAIIFPISKTELLAAILEFLVVVEEHGFREAVGEFNRVDLLLDALLDIPVMSAWQPGAFTCSTTLMREEPLKRRTLCVEGAPLVAFSCQSHVHIRGVRFDMLFSVGR
jgi:hypothetical protein